MEVTHDRSNRGFTLIELLIVIAVLAVLSAVVVLILNPTELLRQSRDSRRIADLAELNSAISLYLADGNSVWPTTCDLTATTTPVGWPALCGSPVVNATTTVYGAGWVNLNLGAISAGSPFSRLPLDPINGPCTSNGISNVTCQYVYAASSSIGIFKLTAKIESSKYYPSMQNDGGIDNTGATALLEVGSGLSMNP